MLYRRRIQDTALRMMNEIPAVMLQGPRTVGKSTLLQEMARPFGGGVLDLDNPAVLERAPFDTEIFSVPGPVFIDEYQKLPEVIDQIKSVLNRGAANGRGRFVLTGSARHDAVPRGVQALTGRLYRLPVLPLAQVELAGAGGNFVEDVFERREPLAASGDAGAADRDRYAEAALTGGFPMAVAAVDEEARGRWFDHYVSSSIMEDARSLRRFHRPDRLPRLLMRLAAQTGGRLNIAKAGSDAGINSATAHVYTRLLEAVFLLDFLPAWTKTGAGTVRRPKVYVVDSGAAGRLLGLTTENLRGRDPFFAARFGQLLETFVVGEVRKMVSWLGDSHRYRIGYWRGPKGAEVDLVVERPSDRGVIAVEVKAGQRVRSGDADGLRLLREYLGGRFFAGLLMNTGDRSYRLEDRIFVTPIDRMWGGAAAPSSRKGPAARREVIAVPAVHRVAGEDEDDPLSAPLRAAVSRMMRVINPEGHPYWEIALIPPGRVRFGDFYTSDGVVGALDRAQAAQRVKPAFGLGSDGRVEVQDRAAVLTDAGRGVLVEQSGSMAAVAVCSPAFLMREEGGGDPFRAELDHRKLAGWVSELTGFAYRELLPHLAAPGWTYWSAARGLKSRPLTLPAAGKQASAVADNPAHKAVDCSLDPAVDGFELLASFYEWFGTPARLTPGGGQRRLAVPPDVLGDG